MRLAHNYIHLISRLNERVEVVSKIAPSEKSPLAIKTIQSLSKAIEELEDFYQDYGIIKFFTHTIQRNSPLSRARRIQNQFIKTQDGLNNEQLKRASMRTSRPLKTYFQLKKSMIASRREAKALLKKEESFKFHSQLKTDTAELANFYKKHPLIKFFTHTIYRPFKTTQLTNSLLTIEKLQAIFNFIPLQVTAPQDLDDIYSPIQVNFSERIKNLFSDKYQSTAKDLVQELLRSRSYGPINEPKVVARLKDLEKLIHNQGLGDLELSEDDAANEAFMIALLFGREDPTIYLENNKIKTPTRIPTTEVEEKLSFFKGKHRNEDEAKAAIIVSFVDAEQNQDEQLISNIFVNIAYLEVFYNGHQGMNLMTYAQLITKDPSEFSSLLIEA
ncbi:MAG: hypothetical protein ACSNEK_07440 [Parachlamydiaceae bacterium]